MTKISKNTLKITAAILCIALVILGGLIGRSRAALLEGDGAQVELGMETLDVQLLENGDAVADGGRLFSSLDDAKIDPGYTYDDAVAVRNSGVGEEYVRVIVTKYWTDENGSKVTSVKPDEIELAEGNGWTANKAESTAEQTVYYYNSSLAAGEDSSPLFTGIRLDGSIAEAYEITEKSDDNKTTLIAAFDYDGLSFNVEAEAQAVQYEHGQEAAGSAWGVTNVTFSGGSVTVQD